MVEKELAYSELRDWTFIGKAAEGDPANGIAPQWTAAAWRLERKFPGRYGVRQDAGPKVNVNVGFRQISIQPQQPRQLSDEGEKGEVIDAEGRVT